MNSFEGKIKSLKTEYVRVCRAKELLDMELGNPERFDPFEEEITGLKAVWAELNKVWQHIESMRETLWTAVIPKITREILDKVL